MHVKPARPPSLWGRTRTGRCLGAFSAGKEENKQASAKNAWNFKRSPQAKVSPCVDADSDPDQLLLLPWLKACGFLSSEIHLCWFHLPGESDPTRKCNSSEWLLADVQEQGNYTRSPGIRGINFLSQGEECHDQMHHSTVRKRAVEGCCQGDHHHHLPPPFCNRLEIPGFCLLGMRHLPWQNRGEIQTTESWTLG